MVSTDIVRRIDEIGRVTIPKDIRRLMHIKEGDLLEFYMDGGNTLILKPYIVGNEALAPLCAKYVAEVSKEISAIIYHDDCVTVAMIKGETATVKRNPQDSFDFNIAVAYALAKMGYKNGNPVVDSTNS